MFSRNENAKYLLVSDVDNTLLGDDEELFNFFNTINKYRSQIMLCYNSGRDVESIRSSIETHAYLPSPDYLIGNIGTQIEHYISRYRDLDREKNLGKKWDRLSVKKAIDKLGFEIQPKKFQSDLKLSYYVLTDDDPIDLVKQTLHRAALTAEVIFSSNRDLDLLPAGCNKGSAVLYLQQKLNFKTHEVIVAGDSKNDLSMFQLGYQGIVVKNASDYLKTELKNTSAHFSSKPFAAGVLEGLKKWMVVPNNE